MLSGGTASLYLSEKPELVKSLMTDTTISNETVTVSIKAKHRNLEITKFLKVATSFVWKVRKELLNEKNEAELAVTRKRKERGNHSADSLRTPGFVRKMSSMIKENRGKSMRHLAKDLQVSEGTTIYKECFSSTPRVVSLHGQKTTHENHLMRAKGLLKKTKHPEEQECLWFFSNENNFHQDEKSIDKMIGGYVRADPTEVPNVMHAHVSTNMREGHIMTPQFFPQSLRVNADADTDADAYVETLQTIAVKLPWIDSVTNGVRPYVFQQELAPSHKAPKTLEYMDGQEFSSSCHAKLMAAS
ncbi:hypothetical protein ACTXT7_015362 [Hymenolepis weldensis]